MLPTCKRHSRIKEEDDVPFRNPQNSTRIIESQYAKIGKIL